MKYQKRFRILLSAAMVTASLLVPITNVYALGDTLYLTETTPRDFGSEDYEDRYRSEHTPYEYGVTDTHMYPETSYRETPYPGDSYGETPHNHYLHTSEYPYTPGNPYEPGTSYTTPGYTHETDDSYTMGYHPTIDEHYDPGNTYNEERTPSSSNSVNEATNKLEKESVTAPVVVEKPKSADKSKSDTAKVAPVVEAVKRAKAENKVEPKAEAKAKVEPKTEVKTEVKAETVVEKEKLLQRT